MTTSIEKYNDIDLMSVIENTNLDDDLKEQLQDVVSTLSSGLEGDMTEETQFLTRVQIRQNTTSPDYMPDETPYGGFFTSKGDNLDKNITLIPLMLHRRRMMWPQDEDSGLKPCNSIDGKTGSVYGDCKKCPHGKYVEGQRTACKSGYRVYGFVNGFSDLVTMDMMGGSGSAAGRQIKQLSKGALYNRTFELETEHIKEKTVNYFKLKAERAGETSEGVRQVADAVSKSLVKGYQQEVEDFTQRAKALSAGVDGTDAIEVTVSDDEDSAVDFSIE